MKPISILKMEETIGGGKPTGTECFLTGVAVLYLANPLGFLHLPLLGGRLKACWNS